MIIMGIDASHRNTGVCVLKAVDQGHRWVVENIIFFTTFETSKRAKSTQELEDIRSVVRNINSFKALYAVWLSACEIAHSGKNFGSSRNVGITWGIAIGTDSHAYTQHEVRAMFKDKSKDGPKEKALRFLTKHNLSISHQVNRMNDHEVDAACVAIYHLNQLKKYDPEK